MPLAKVVVARGNPLASLMIIGEAPGAKEDELGEPFVGRSGRLLDKLLEESGIDSQEDVYICNTVKCRPPNNRRPSKKELQLSLPWLYQQIVLVDPKIIILLGATSVEILLGKKDKMSDIRGEWQYLEGRTYMPLFHPSYLLRNPSKEFGQPLSLTKADLLMVRDRLELSDPNALMGISAINKGGN